MIVIHAVLRIIAIIIIIIIIIIMVIVTYGNTTTLQVCTGTQ